MKLPRSFRTCCIAVALSVGSLLAQQPGAPEQAAQQALELFNSGRTKEAADAYAAILKNFPTSPVVSEAQFRLGYLDYQLGDFDKSIAALKKILGPPATAEIQELAHSLLPQAMSAKAAKLPATDSKRKAAFEDTIKQFDVFLQKFPGSDDLETANYGRALALYQIERYDEAASALRDNLQRFPKSESILDSQYLLALTLATQGNVAMRTPNARPAAAPKYDEAIKLLQEIVTRRTDVALANDAQFQIGEVQFNRASVAEEAQRPQLYGEAIAAYRAVQPKELTVAGQELRSAGILERIRAAGAARNAPEVKKLQRLIGREQTKLAMLKAGADKTVSAQIKVGTCFYLQRQYDAARVLFRHYEPFAEDAEQKKQILYCMTMSYASQNLVDKAVAGYEQFQQSYKGDPVADNLPLMLGILFLNADPKINNPAKAVGYFKDSITLYPKGRFVNDSLAQQANALIQLKQYDEALKTFRDFAAKSSDKSLAAQAELGIATIYKDTGKLDDAAAAFRTVRDKYAGTPPAEQAAFWVGQILAQKNDAKGAVAELRAFVTKFPASALVPAATYAIAQAQAASGDKEGALKTYQELLTKWPKTEAGSFAYFGRATILAADGKTEEMTAEMRQFIAAYPESDKVFFAYDSIGQNLAGTKPLEAIAAYREMTEKFPQNPQAAAAFYQIAQLSQRYAESQGRYAALTDEQRTAWTKGLDESTKAAEQILEKFPESQQAALALQTLLHNQRLLAQARVKTEQDVEKYFDDLSEKPGTKPEAKGKILFTLAAFTYERSKAKALAQMSAAFDPKLVYAPADIDLYGTALFDTGKPDESLAIYEKLAKDFPNPPGVAPEKAPPQIAEAQSLALYGIGRALQKQGKVAEAAQRFDTLKKLYPWSPKILEANFGIAQSMVQQAKFDDAMALLTQIIRAPAATAELRANSMLLGGEIQEKKGALEPAIDYYLKIAPFYEAIAPAAAEGLWRGAELLEKQAAGLPETSAEKSKPTRPGQIAKATKAYSDLTTRYPNSEFAAKAKDRLAQLSPGK